MPSSSADGSLYLHGYAWMDILQQATNTLLLLALTLGLDCLDEFVLGIVVHVLVIASVRLVIWRSIILFENVFVVWSRGVHYLLLGRCEHVGLVESDGVVALVVAAW